MAQSRVHYLPILVLLITTAVPLAAKGPARKKLQTRELSATDVRALWRDPGDMRARDLFYGIGGKKDEPQGPFTFLKEDTDGTNPKFSVKDAQGTKWKVKLGEEARPETAATRFVWAVGYYTDEDYFVRELKVEKMAHLKRGQSRVSADGVVHDARLEREAKEDKKTGGWEWSDNPYRDTREWNGLRVMMALINNWDLKDVNNSIRVLDGQPVYVVSDLGATFGTTGWSVSRGASKGNLNAYEHSRFISKVTTEYVNFNVPTRPALIHLFGFPEFFRRVHLEWIGKHVPVSDVRWMGKILSGLSDEQVESAFRAAGYEGTDAKRFSAVVEKRIAELGKI